MQHEMENDTHLDIEATVRAFIDTKLSSELQALRLSFRQPLRNWFTSTRDSLLRLKKDDENRYKQIIDLLDEKLPELKSIIESLETDSWHANLEESLSKASLSLPEEMTEIQKDSHLKSQPDDSVMIRQVNFSSASSRKLRVNH